MRLRLLLQPVLCALSLTGLFLLLRNLFIYASTAPVSFDGAMNLNVAASLAAGSGYGFFYDTFFPFPAQTDGPFILPAALLILAFGISPLVTQAVNLLYIGLLIPLLTALLRRLGLPLWAALVGTLIAISVPGFAENGMNGYGEIPALAWYLGGLLAFGTTFKSTPLRYQALLAGALLATAYLTKVVALVLVGPVFAVALFFAFQQQVSRKVLLQLCCGFILPIVLWEIFRLLSIGSLSGFLLWWKLQLGQILHQSGAGHSVAGFARKASEHFSTLCFITGLNAYLLTGFLALPCFLFLYARDQFTIAEKFYFLCLLISGLVYFLWWLLLTPSSMAWLRRILDAIIIHQILLLALGFRIVSSMRTAAGSPWLRRGLAFSLSAVAVIPVLTLAKTGQNLSEPLKAPAYTASFFKLASNVRELPADAVIFGTGWWKSPGIALYSGRRFHNFQHWTPDKINRLKNKYFVFDPFILGIAKGDATKALALTDAEEMIKSDGGELYRISNAKHYAPVQITPSDFIKLKSKMDFSEGDYEYKSGFYQVEDNKWAWMRTDGLVVLARAGERRLIISFFLPDQLIKGKPVNLRVEVPGCAEETFHFSSPGENSVALTLNCPANRERAPLYAYLHVNQHMPFVNQIDTDNRLLSVLVRSVKLVN